MYNSKIGFLNAKTDFILGFFTKQIHPRSRIMVLQRNRRIVPLSECGIIRFMFDATCSERSWIHLFRKETRNPFSDLKKRVLDFQEPHPNSNDPCIHPNLFTSDLIQLAVIFLSYIII